MVDAEGRGFLPLTQHERPRSVLPEGRIHPAIRGRISTLNADLVSEVEAVLSANTTVVVGMSVNPSCRRVCTTLEARGLTCRYLEYGGYHTNWRRRLALKMWTGWATFPMVFHQGALLGGAKHLVRFLDSDEGERA